MFGNSIQTLLKDSPRREQIRENQQPAAAAPEAVGVMRHLSLATALSSCWVFDADIIQ